GLREHGAVSAVELDRSFRQAARRIEEPGEEEAALPWLAGREVQYGRRSERRRRSRFGGGHRCRRRRLRCGSARRRRSGGRGGSRIAATAGNGSGEDSEQPEGKEGTHRQHVIADRERAASLI